MHEIVVISGKGGTGKTTVCSAFAHLMGNGVICDLDVDAPDMHIILEPEVLTREAFISGNTAVIRQTDCTRCGQCRTVCRFGAVLEENGAFVIDPGRCEGCGVCVELCPASAVDFPEKHCGEEYFSHTRFGPFIHALLSPGEENSGRLVSKLKSQARTHAKEHGLDTILCDGSPGIGCAVISSLSGAHLAVAVVEPTPSGIHDFKRVADLCLHFRIPVAVLINKADLNPDQTASLEAHCREHGFDIIGRLPFSQDVVSAMIHKQALTETSSPLAGELVAAWGAVNSLLEKRANTVSL